MMSVPTVWLLAAASAALPMTWQMERRSDPATGLKHCLIRSLGGEVTASLAERPRPKPSVWTVTIGFDNRPGSLRYLRIGRRVFQTDRKSFRGERAAEIVARLKTPETFVFEWEWGPEAAKRGGLFATGDFAAKAARCEHWLRGPRA